MMPPCVVLETITRFLYIISRTSFYSVLLLYVTQTAKQTRMDPGPPHSRGFTTTLTNTTLGTTLLAEWIAWRSDNTQHSKRQTSMPPAGFEPAIPAKDQLPTHALADADLDRRYGAL